jgi:hypothetical protein
VNKLLVQSIASRVKSRLAVGKGHACRGLCVESARCQCRAALGNQHSVGMQVDGALLQLPAHSRAVALLEDCPALCCAALCCAVLCCAVLCCAVLCCAVVTVHVCR